ncbi:TPA: 50S ribosome-binding GTPase [Klebsiella pneumoniae]|uniref:EutP/PduV family microcompartment system protein n=1 Tax=Klebsiella pneumoniae TaxID=573 RepID=UPI00192AA21A|nr:EutP/PduV family microcompartment system protein [Klebsiella pneumoniae]MBL4322681.1 50S ribosome-binding GTPase [Klebsiella pneumoniae]HCT9291058.1 50S ribosome-binding GTPase [Klebsiella pneumoniae]HDE2699167.1 50S ribosome-binding GTPase [Klebsiella pneumoniae]
MKRIAIVGAVGAGKTTLFNALQGNYSLARKTQALEFNDRGDIDIVAISKTDLPDANVAAVRQLLDGMGFQAPVFALNGCDPQSVAPLENYLSELSQKEEGPGEETHYR